MNSRPDTLPLRCFTWALAALAAFVVIGACVPSGGGSTDGGGTAPVESTNDGLVDGGGFFSEGDDANPPPPIIPESTEESDTESFFAARSIDPASEDSAGPKFVVTDDIDGDGLPDLATAWNQNQVIQIHLQRRDIDGNVSFETVQIAGTTPIAIVAGIELADIDGDGRLDLVVLAKHDGGLAICPLDGNDFATGFVGVVVVYFAPAGDITNGANWIEMEVTASREANADPPGGFPPGLPESGPFRAADAPETGGMTAIEVADVTLDGRPDIMVTSNRPVEPCHPSHQNDIELYPNPGPATARTGAAWNQVLVERGAPPLKDLRLVDIDEDGDLDVLYTRPTSSSGNIRWIPNVGGTFPGPALPIGHIDGGADVTTLGDVDVDGHVDVVVRSNEGQLIQWFRHPSPDDSLNVTDVLAGIPWSVFTLIELTDSNPLGITLGDINFDGIPEVLLGADGRILWLDSSTPPTIFDEWTANLIVDDSQVNNQLFSTVGAAFINNLLVVDIDCDGANDVIGTIDRQDSSGLSTDVLVWFRNTLLPEDVGIDEPLVPGCP